MKPSPARLLIVALLGLLVLPVANVVNTGSGLTAENASVAFLYNADLVKGAIARVLTPLGISIVPKEVIVGKDQWLYLGDHYSHVVTDSRRTATAEDRRYNERSAAAMQAWKRHLADRGITVFSIMVAPDKHSIYPDMAPRWMQVGSHTPLDALFQDAGADRIDLRPVLVAARQANDIPVYFSTDTHWNYLGAASAFREFARRIAAQAPGLRWPSEDLYAPLKVEPRDGMGLSAFLQLKSAMRDTHVTTRMSRVKMTTVRTDFCSGAKLYEGPRAAIPSPMKPLVLHNGAALNRKRVLWLRDSFGTLLSPYMSHTFSDVLQFYWPLGLKPGRLAELVDRWKPDYVFITVVERDARDQVFTVLPSAAAAPGDSVCLADPQAEP